MSWWIVLNQHQSRSSPRKRGPRAKERKIWIPACAGMSGTCCIAPLRATLGPRFRGDARRLASTRTIHLAGRRQYRIGGIELGDDAPAPAGLLFVKRLLVAAFTERRDIEWLEELMVFLAHEAIAAVEDVELHAFQLGGNLGDVERLCLVDGRDQHADFIDGARIEQAEVVLGPQRLLEILRRLVRDIGQALADLEHTVVDAALLDGGRAAGAGRIISVPVDLQARIRGGFQQKREVLPPIAGDDAVSPGRLDLGDVWGEIGDLQQRVKLVTDDLDVGTLGSQHLARFRAHGLAERVVLVDQIEFLDIGPGLHVVGQRRHLDVGVRIPAEVPVAALVVGQDRIDRRVVQINEFLARISLDVFRGEIGDCGGNRRSIALRDNPNSGIERLLDLNQAFLRIDLVVIADDLELLAEHPALRIDFLGKELESLEADFADARPATRQRIDIGDLEGILPASGRRYQAKNRHKNWQQQPDA